MEYFPLNKYGGVAIQEKLQSSMNMSCTKFGKRRGKEIAQLTSYTIFKSTSLNLISENLKNTC